MIEPRIHLTEICQRFSVDILYVFGSRATQVYHWFNGYLPALPASNSDVDIGVKPSATAKYSVHDKVLLALELEDLLQVPRVDLVLFSDATPFLAANMVRGERLYTRDSHLAAEYELYVLRRAGDLIPMERERVELILGDRLL
jgi:hypothetical protein